MAVTIRADIFAENLEPEELGEILATIAGDFGSNTKAFAAFMLHACDQVRNQHRMTEDNDVADEVFAVFENASAKHM